ncbi:folylpolyglutamate synthase, mitochondrial isoform X2 [Petromyzon marinus]|uniref:folylpolyglutamate synthase, mitochondrial isoform X2 n=1 Tax=Petromyzon marinus TaxID=7757 RepID=UPI003F701BD5
MSAVSRVGRALAATPARALGTSSSSSSSSHWDANRDRDPNRTWDRWCRAARESRQDRNQNRTRTSSQCQRPIWVGQRDRGDSNFASAFRSDRDVDPDRQPNLDRNRELDVAPSALSMEYEEAIKVLNRLQTNAQTLQQTRRDHGRQASNQLPLVERYLQRCQINVGDLDRLNVIHVSGTKGKGSTCAFTERILHKLGFKTGLYTSPHLVQVRERIRINGQPISEQLYTKYFWEIYNRLNETMARPAHLILDSGNPMPAYFRFLTIMAFHVFLQEKVDLAVVEVGIGGAFDCTNIVRKPTVCGVASLGMDHMSILGNTIEKIAWQKAGIFKRGVPAFTVEQPPSAMTILQERARELDCPLQVCPPLSAYADDAGHPDLGLAGEHQRLNATLALQLSRAWLRRYPGPGLRAPPAPATTLDDGSERAHEETKANGNTHYDAHDSGSSLPTADPFPLSPAMLQGLKETEWPGRSQILRRGPVTFYLDGAHTVQSVEACIKWFQKSVLEEEGTTRDPVVRVLLFNMTGDRDSAAILGLLQACQFDCAVFCPNITNISPDSSDQVNYTVTPERVMAQCAANQTAWDQLCRTRATPSRAAAFWAPEPGASRHGAAAPAPRPLSRATSRNPAIPSSAVFPCISEALRWIGSELEPELRRVQVLITGSLHLVGGALKCLEFGLS